MATSTYYPGTNDGRAEWWTNIEENGMPVLTELGFSSEFRAEVALDAAWGKYIYDTLRDTYENAVKVIIGYCNTVAYGTPGEALPETPVPPPWPPLPESSVEQGLEKRREAWVQSVKNAKGYNALTHGVLLRIEAPSSPFDPTTYKAILFSLSSPGPHLLRGKFRKAGGRIDGIELYGRRAGTSEWVKLGRYTTAEFTAGVPVSGSAPEAWEFQARAVIKDQEVGLPSDILEAIIRG